MGSAVGMYSSVEVKYKYDLGIGDPGIEELGSSTKLEDQYQYQYEIKECASWIRWERKDRGRKEWDNLKLLMVMIVSQKSQKSIKREINY